MTYFVYVIVLSDVMKQIEKTLNHVPILIIKHEHTVLHGLESFILRQISEYINESLREFVCKQTFGQLPDILLEYVGHVDGNRLTVYTMPIIVDQIRFGCALGAKPAAACHASRQFSVYRSCGKHRAVRQINLLLEFGKVAALVAFDRVAQNGHAGFGATLAEYADSVRRVLSHKSHELQNGLR